MLKTQMIAFKSLSKNQSLQPQLYQALFKNRNLGAPSSGFSSPQQLVSGNANNAVSEAASDHAESVSGTPEPLSIKKALGVESFEVINENRVGEFVPSIMPFGIDVHAAKLAREAEIVDKINDRITHLKHELQSSPELDKEIELRSLQLLNYNKALKGDLLTWTMYFNSSGLDESNRNLFLRWKKLSLQEAQIIENFSHQQSSERARRENQKKIDHITHVCKHSEAVLASKSHFRTKHTKLGHSVAQFHSVIEKEEQKRIERTAKQRLQALRANDEEAYIKLLDQTKDTRITHLLRQTNTFLKSLTSAVKDQQREAGHSSSTRGEEDEEENEEADYYAVAHKIREEVTKQPSILVGGTLKEYQIKGLQWMVSLFNNNLNGILADEMGLGKTIQSISLITYLIEAKRIPGPFLVIVPLSTLTNWNLEFERWAPAVKKVVYKGPPLARRAQQGTIRSGDFQVLLTTFEYIIKDRPLLSRVKWVHMIIDEGHRMKNSNSKLSSTLTQYYSSKYRLILTGTPLQNNLPELWALLNFVLPKIFNSVKSFDEWFNTPFANTGGQDKIDLSEEETLLIIRRLHKVLRPFLLRRLKKDVEKDLPDKVEKVLKCKMSALQLKLYQQMIKHKVLFFGENAHGANRGGLKGLNNQIMQLRKICNHPFVFEEVENLVNPEKSTNDMLWRTAGKFELLDRVLPKFKATGHRVLIFFQMTQIMDIMEDFLRLRGLQYLRLDGGTKAEDRSELLKLFNAPNSPYFAFLLSTRAGGLGLNLQTADTVIIYDTDWNPHQDLQAQDRAHRIGQTKEVRILRLITEASVEENILERAHHKLDIDGKVIQAGKFDNKSTSEEQEAFLRSLLEAEDAKRDSKDEEDDDMDEEELNDILARNDDEKIIFKQMDQDRIREAEAAGNGDLPRLISEEELPEVYKSDIIERLKLEEQQAQEFNVDQFGRYSRPRKAMRYDDLLTEEQWLEAVDNDDDTIEDAIARKRARIEKKKSKAHKDGDMYGFSDEEEDFVDPGTPEGGRKRRKVKREITPSVSTPQPTASVGGVGKKRSKGRPPKVKETLTPEARAQLQVILNKAYDAMMDLKDEESGRAKIDLFLEVPSKRLYPDYYVLIKEPIACDIIAKRINNHTYQSIDDLRKDVHLMFQNARTYNEEGSIVVLDANDLRAAFDECLDEYEHGAQKQQGEDEDNEPNESLPEHLGDDTRSNDLHTLDHHDIGDLHDLDHLGANLQPDLHDLHEVSNGVLDDGLGESDIQGLVDI